MAAVNHAQAIMASQNINESYDDDQSTITSIETSTTATSFTARPRRSGSVKSWRSNPSFMSSGFSSRQWDSEIESLLKEMYSAIKLRQILQPISSSSDKSEASNTSNTPTLGLKRSRSHLGHPNYSNSRVNALKKGLSAGTAKSRKNANGRISPSPSSVSGGSDSSIGVRTTFNFSVNYSFIFVDISFILISLTAQIDQVVHKLFQQHYRPFHYVIHRLLTHPRYLKWLMSMIQPVILTIELLLNLCRYIYLHLMLKKDYWSENNIGNQPTREQRTRVGKSVLSLLRRVMLRCTNLKQTLLTVLWDWAL
jgi:hypothetical protein